MITIHLACYIIDAQNEEETKKSEDKKKYDKAVDEKEKNCRQKPYYEKYNHHSTVFFSNLCYQMISKEINFSHLKSITKPTAKTKNVNYYFT